MNLSSLLTFNRGRSLFLPFHGRGRALPIEMKRLLRSNPGVWDLPELPDLGGPLEVHGAIADSQKESAQIVGADHCWYGVNGATGLLQAALLAMAKPGQGILLPRNVHRSVINACILGDLVPIFFDLPFLSDRGHVKNPDDEWLKKILHSIDGLNIKIQACVFVNPTYQGYSSNMKVLIDRLHKYGVPVLVDEAHGAHFLFANQSNLPLSALSSGADLVVNSLHKSSIGLVQTAVLWMQGDLVDLELLETKLSIFQTSSPSSLLLASCQSTISESTSSHGRKRIMERLEDAQNIFSNLKRLGLPLLTNQDPFKLILHTAPYGISGFQADDCFISKGLVGELPEPGTITFCLGLASQRGLVSFMNKRWENLLSLYPKNKPLSPFIRPPIPLVSAPSIPLGSLFKYKSCKIPIQQAIGRTASEMVCPYPPGIPLVFPGEILDEKRIFWLSDQQKLWPQLTSGLLTVLA